MKKHLVIAWEMGEGFGHVLPMTQIGQYFRDKGWHVSFITKDIYALSKALGDASFPVYPAPQLIPGKPRYPQVQGFAHTLSDSGFLDPQVLAPALHAWRHLFTLLNPCLLMLDYAPTALVAACQLNMPCGLIGSGFCIPPNVETLPSYQGETLPSLKDAEAHIVAAINQQLDLYQRSPIHSVGEFHAQADFQALLTTPELDHYPDRPAATYLGPLLHSTGRQCQWRTSKKKVLAYLKYGYPHLPKLLSVLTHQPYEIIVAIPDAPGSLRQRPSSPNLQLFTELVDIEPLLQGADAFIHHGGHSSIHWASRYTVPSLVFPLNREQWMGAKRVEEQRRGVICPNLPALPALLRQAINLSFLIQEQNHQQQPLEWLFNAATQHATKKN